jgi:predicted naringenin-chalcone synthase
MSRGRIASIASAFPPSMTQQALWDGYFADRFEDGDRDRAGRIWANVGVGARGGVVAPVDEDVSTWGTERRMQRFAEAALPLASNAVCRSLEAAGLRATDIDLLTVVSCTGYGTPGLDIRLVDHLGMPPTTQRLHVGHMGCYAAVPGLATVVDAATARGRTSVMVCVELASLHLQPPSDDLEQLVAHALFADAAAAVVVTPGGPGLELVDVVSRTDTARADLMTWDVTDHGFRMGLSPRVPAVLARHVADVVRDLLAPHRLDVGDVAAWAVHPGGPRILDVVADRLGLEEDQLWASREVLCEHGNCSSPTVLVILQRLVARRALGPGDAVVALAFGPGLTLYAALLRRTGG